MFMLRVHSVDTNQRLSFFSDFTTTATPDAASPSNSNPSSNFFERRGVVHLFRSISRHPAIASQSNVTSPSPLLFVVAVPSHLSPLDFVRFCGSYVDHIYELIVFRNDGLEDRYSILIKFADQIKADGFHQNFNGRWFSPAEAELCHILVLHSVDYTELAEAASLAPAGYAELPTCPVCLERLDQDISGIQSTLCDHSFLCSCISKWTYLSCQVCQLCQKRDEKPTCFVCATSENLWVCLLCGFVGCGRYKEGHAIKHWKDTQHCYSLDLETQRVWDYDGDNYVHRLNQSKADGKEVMENSNCMPPEGDYDTCRCSEDSGISRAFYNSKVEAIEEEYNRLLATQLDTQRQYYESLLLEAKGTGERSFPEAGEKDLILKLQDIQDKLEKGNEANKVVAEINQSLINSQEGLRKKLKEIQEREQLTLKLKDEKLRDLEEQIRDLSVYIEAQKALDSMAGSEEIKGGTLLPVPLKQTSSGSMKRHTRSGRRRN